MITFIIKLAIALTPLLGMITAIALGSRHYRNPSPIPTPALPLKGRESLW
jgi:hypothetical protein